MTIPPTPRAMAGASTVRGFAGRMPQTCQRRPKNKPPEGGWLLTKITPPYLTLSETRKFRLGLTLSHQYLGQLTEGLQKAEFGNVGTIVSFRVDQGGADALAREFHYTYRPEAFTALDNYEICVKPLLYGKEGEPFLGRTFAPDFMRYGRSEKIIKRSRERYTRPRAVVEDRLRR